MANISTLLQNRRGPLAISNVTGLQTALEAVSDSVATLTPAATVDIDLSTGTIFTLTPNANTTFTLSNTTAVDSFTLTLTGAEAVNGFELASASYDSVNFSVNSQDITPVGLAFNTDGTKMYMLGLDTATVYQYTLSTGFDLSTASYDSVSFSVASQDINPHDVAFNTDGTKMYMLGTNSDTVFQYSSSILASYSITYPAAFKWPAGTAPDTPADAEVDVITVFTVDGGTTWYAFQAGDAMA